LAAATVTVGDEEGRAFSLLKRGEQAMALVRLKQTTSSKASRMDRSRARCVVLSDAIRDPRRCVDTAFVSEQN